MNKLLLLIVFTITTTLSVHAAEFNVDDINFYAGGPSANKIVTSGDMYVVIHNPIEFAYDAMEQGAKDYCKQTFGNNSITTYTRILGRYTAYFSCEMQNKIDQYTLSDEENKCIEDIVYTSTNKNCINLNKKNVDVINGIELQKTNEEKYKTFDFIYSVRTKFYNKIEEFEQASEEKRINEQIQHEIDLLNIPINAILNQLKIEKNIEICKKYTLQEEGPQLFSECILKIIERGN